MAFFPQKENVPSQIALRRHYAFSFKELQFAMALACFIISKAERKWRK
jgi:hypothetical protein